MKSTPRSSIAKTDVQTTAYMTEMAPGDKSRVFRPKFLPKSPEQKRRRLTFPNSKTPDNAVVELFPNCLRCRLSRPVPGPEGRPYTLADLHRIAAANSPDLRQATADVETARGNLIQARAYPNPTVGWTIQPSNDGSTPGTGVLCRSACQDGRQAQAGLGRREMDFQNSSWLSAAPEAIWRRRPELLLLVARRQRDSTRERGGASLTDQIYRLQADLAAAGSFAAPYEPMALRAQAYTAELAHQQAIQTYIYDGSSSSPRWACSKCR